MALFRSSSSTPGKGQDEYRLVPSVASEAMGIGKSSEVLTVLGGKASCRRKFVLNVHLVDDHGNLVLRDLAIVASVAYAHNRNPVVRDEKPFLAEPPLFTTFNGVEFPAQDRPTRMVSGRASFKLAISLLSSKCDNRLFCICFTPETASGDDAPVTAPCYSKPIRSISRKRTQSFVNVSPPPPLVMSDSKTSPSNGSRTRQYNNKADRERGGRLESDSALGGSKFNASPSTSSENDGATSPASRAILHSSSRPSSVTSIHYLPPTPAAGLAGMPDEGGRDGCKEGTLVLHGSPASAQSTAGTMGGLLAAPGEARRNERLMEPSGNSFSGMGNSCIESMKVTSPPCSLSLRLSPSDSGSPTSGALTSESSYDNNHDNNQLKDPAPAGTQSLPLAVGNSRPCFTAPNFPQPVNARPFRPFATVGPCKVVMASDFHLGNGISLASQSAKRSTGGDGGQASTKTLLERVHQQSEAPPARRHQHSNENVDSVMHSFTLGSEMRSISNNDDRFNSALTEISLEEEEKSLEYIEVSLQEVSREVHRRMEELRSKRRRLLEDEARMHSIIFQSASWIERLSGRYSL